MTDQRTDAALVGAFLAGDRAAFATVYDRFADSLHDTAAITNTSWVTSAAS